ncbi:MAG: hypothetical protein LBE85_11740, partial [Candidatus Accumulibacter sp.]|nr:hypothetical protein [Accumulibacter sp.]
MKLLNGKMEADHPEYVAAMVQALLAQGVPQQAYGQICKDKECDYIHYLTTTRSSSRDVVTADSPAAVLRSGGDMVLAAIALENHYQYTDLSTTRRVWHWVSRDHGSTTEAERVQTLIGGVPAIISAGGLLTGSFTERIDNLS